MLAGSVRSAMRTTNLPTITADQDLGCALTVMNKSGLELGIVIDQADGRKNPRALGIVTDGDVRRALERDSNALARPVAAVMSENPVFISPDAGVDEAKSRMHHLKLNTLLVLDDQSRLHGVVDLYSL
jgi:arabinose-5-phosphate isomerase